MPAIHIFQKRTVFGGDDLQVPALFTVLARVVQGTLFVLPQCYYLVKEAALSSHSNNYLLEFMLVDPSDSKFCRHSHFFPLLSSMYLLATALFGVASISLEYRLWWWSGQGTPTLHRQPRTSRVESLLECKLLVFTTLLVLIVATWASSMSFYSLFVNCRSELEQQNDDTIQYPLTVHWIGTNSWWVANILLPLSQISEILLAVAFWARLVQVDRMHSQSVDQHASHDHHEFTEELWADRCHWMCQCLSMSTCFLFGGQDFMRNDGPNGVPYYKQLSQALADYLETRGTLDVVPTDLVTGLLVLQRLQRQRILQARVQVVLSSQSQLHLMQRLADTRRNLLTDGFHDSGNADDVDRHLIRSVSDVPTMSTKSPSTLRSRVGSSNDLRRAGTAASPASLSAGGLKNRALASSSSTSSSSTAGGTTNNISMDLPETTRLVPTAQSFPGAVPSTQVIYRRLEEDGTEPRSPPGRRSPYGPTCPPYYSTQTRAVLNPHNPVDLLRMQEGARMAKYALSIYTWMLYLFVHPVTGVPRLLCRSCHLCRRCGNRATTTETDPTTLVSTGTTMPSDLPASRSSLLDSRGATIGDNLCGWHKQSLLLVAGLPEADLMYAQFVNRFSLVPYCILLDHATQSVVVSVRGSLSLDDLVTDVHMDPECVKKLAQEHGFDVDEDQYCHAGVVASARNVYADLQRHGLLDQLLRNDYPEYHLRLVGHSLGAGVCTLLGYMLQSRFPSLKVFNFSPPGCTMTWGLATKCESWATSYILDSDIVPRLSVLGLERLRNEVLELVGRLKVPKYQVVQSFWTGHSRRACCWGASSDNAAQDLEDLTVLIDEWLFEEEEEDEMVEAAATSGASRAGAPSSNSPYHTTYYQQLREFWCIQEERKRTRGSTRSIRLYPPGRMIHLVKTGEEGGCGNVAKKIATCCTTNSGFQYTPVYIANDDLDEILVSPTMATDHFIDRMVDELSNLAKMYADTSLTTGDSFEDRVGTLL